MLTDIEAAPLESGPQTIPELIPGADLRVVEMAAHGLYHTHEGLVLSTILDMMETGD